MNWKILIRRPGIKRLKVMEDADYHGFMVVFTYFVLWITTLAIRWGLGEQEATGVMLVALSGLPAGICAGLAYTTIFEHIAITSRDMRVTDSILTEGQETEEGE